VPVYFLALFLLAQSDEIAPLLTQAETLFYQARFNDSIVLLEKVDLMLQQQPGRLEEKTRTKLHLALTHLGLNRTDLAKDDLRDLLALDSDYYLDPRVITPKLIALANEIKAAWNSDADLILKEGVERVKQGQFSEARPKFETVLKLVPGHVLAQQYLELVRIRLQVEADRLFLDWQRNFEARQFEPATKAYVALNDLDDGSNLKLVHHMRTAYRNALLVLVQESKDACARGDLSKLAEIQKEISKMLPDPSIGEGILSGDEQSGSNCKDPDDHSDGNRHLGAADSGDTP
jgi:tetratricopeptide (TPR) repeat protein